MLRKLLSRRVPASSPGNAAHLLDVALREHQAGRTAQAEALYEQILARDAANPDALHFLGVAAYQSGRLARAEQLIARSIALQANNPAAHNNLGNVLLASGRAAEAAASYRQAVALQPGHVDAQVNLGSLLLKRGNAGEAAACYEKALAAAPDSARLHFHLAVARSEQGELEEAIGGFRRALALQPEYPEASIALGTALLELARPAEAEQSYAAALRLQPGLGRAKFGTALAKLMQGDYAGGFALYESRFDESALAGPAYAGFRAELERLRDVPRWTGEIAPGKRLLVWTDQGFGDALMFMRYLRLLKARGLRRVVVHCEPALVRVIERTGSADEVRPRPAAVESGEFDCHCPMSSLPLAFATRLESIPCDVPYITVPEAMKAEWKTRLAADPGRFRVGLIWAGRRDFPKDALRSIRLERFAPLFRVPGVTFVSLQKGEEAAQRLQAGLPMLDWMEECRDLLDTAALMDQLDLVIGVDTGVLHLAAALGRPTWLLNRFESEWRWMLGRDDCAWYPTLRIFRQRERGGWDEVLLRVAAALNDRLGHPA